jgi:hypothetical protein
MSEEGKNLRLGLVIEAIDRATGVIAKVNERVETMLRPVHRVQAAWHEFGEKARFEEIGEKVKGVGEAWEKVNNSAIQLFNMEAIAGGAGAALVELVHKVGEAGERVGILSRSLGISARQFQGFDFAVRTSGGGADTFAESMKFLNRSIVEAMLSPDNPTMRFFRAMGISWEDLRHKSPLDIFLKISDWAEKYPVKARETLPLLTLLGRGRGAEQMISVLQKGSEELKKLADEAGKKRLFNDEDIESSEHFLEAFKGITASITGLTNTVVAKAFPIITKGLDDLSERIDAMPQERVEQMAKSFGDFVSHVPDLLAELVQLAGILGAIITASAKVADAFGGWDKIIAIMVGARIVQLIAALGQLGVAFVSLDAAIVLNPLTWIPLAIAGVVALGVAIYTHWAPLKAWVRDLWYGIQDDIGGVIDWIAQKVNMILHPVDALSNWVGGNFNSYTAPNAPPIGVKTFPAAPFAPAAPTISDGASAGRQAVDVGARLDIHVEDKRVKVKRVQTRGPMDVAVHSGPLAAGAAQ